MRAIVLMSALALLGATPGTATDNRLKIDVTPRISQAPAVIRIRATVAPNAENRGLRIVADSGDYYRSSFVPLAGADAASITEASFKNLPGGDYEISVTLIDDEGRTTIDRRTVMVTSSVRR